MKALLLQLGLIAVSVSAVLFMVKPMYESISVIQSESEEYDVALASAREANSKLAALRKTVEDVSEQNKYRMMLLVPEKLEPIKAANDIEIMAQSTGMFLDTISLGTAMTLPDPTGGNTAGSQTDDEGFDTFGAVNARVANIYYQDILVSVSGTYEQFKQLLAMVESSARLTDIMTLSFEGSSTDLDSYSLTLRVYGKTTAAPVAR